MELTLANTVSNLLILLSKSLFWDFENVFSSVCFFLQTNFPKCFSTKWDHCGSKMEISNSCGPLVQISKTVSDACSVEKTMSIAELNLIINRLGMEECYTMLEDNRNNKSFGAKEFSALFDEEEPSLDEIRETFGVFDVNKDGFIDAGELQRVVSKLGLKEDCELEECTRMIRAFDGNGDDLIDFKEFVKFMEKCLC